ncbi:ankyrin repeat domain-containing protein [uncultured Kordia sp.]|uniref:ankyrin repeat domain-containing protein n=1 Tax=uncultured Kordia sp. TaxID=507699 RepID=UPI002601B25D|nr:ankyrin repeat domain-containing protein [uncultured Kordia sp.]
MIAILLKASIALFVFLAFYKLFLERESFYTVNRWYLISCLALAFILPFISVPQLVNHQGYVSEVITSFETHESATTHTIPVSKEGDTPEIMLTEVEEEQIVENTTNASISAVSKPSLSLLDWILGIYFFGVIVFALHLLFQVLSVWLKIIRSDDKIHDENAIIINHPSIKEPCSFFNYIFINPENYDYETYEQILAHERVHVDKKHSVDLLFAELVKVFLWFNPFVWMYRKSVEKNIEFQTDATLLNTETIENDQYQLSLLKIATYTKPLTITTNYNQSLIKKRIVKMNSKKSNPHSYWKYSFLAPTLIVLILFLNKPLTAATVENAIIDTAITNAPEKEEITTNEITPKITTQKTLTAAEIEASSDCARLLKAIADNDVAKVKELLKTVDANCIDKNAGYVEKRTDEYIYRNRKPQTPLVAAARTGNLVVGKLLIEAGAKADFFSPENEPPAFAAAAEGSVEFLKLLVANGISIDKAYTNHGTALITAALKGHLDAVKYIHGQGADVNKSVMNVGTPLIGAARCKDIEIVKFLLDKGADPDKHVMNVGTPLIYAARTYNSEAIKLLIAKGADVNKEVANVGTPLIYAARKGHPEVIKLLLAKGADVDKQSPNVGTPMIYAARNGHTEAIKLLLNNGADIDKEVANVGTPLLYAARNGNIEAIKLLLNKGADIDKEVVNVGTPLLYAARNANVEVVKLLLDKGANINKGTANVGTPLLYAARKGHKEILNLLLDKGADINKEVANVGTPLIYAARNGHKDIIALLLNKGADINKAVTNVGTPLIYAARSGHTDIVKLLLDKGAKVDLEAPNVGTALSKAVRSKNQEVAKILLEAGADPYLVSRHNDYPMYYAVKNKDKDMQTLLERYKK